MRGAELIAAERERQVSQEGWTAEHDSGHQEAELAAAAACYLGFYLHQVGEGWSPALSEWPWERRFWKPSPGEVRNLVKAGALIAAEIDRLQRASEAAS